MPPRARQSTRRYSGGLRCPTKALGGAPVEQVCGGTNPSPALPALTTRRKGESACRGLSVAVPPDPASSRVAGTEPRTSSRTPKPKEGPGSSLTRAPPGHAHLSCDPPPFPHRRREVTTGEPRMRQRGGVPRPSTKQGRGHGAQNATTARPSQEGSSSSVTRTPPRKTCPSQLRSRTTPPRTQGHGDRRAETERKQKYIRAGPPPSRTP